MGAVTGDIPQAWRESPSDDPYDIIPGINDRDAVKGMIVRMIGSGSPYKRAGKADFDAGMATCSWQSPKENGPAYYAANDLYHDRMESIRKTFPQVMHLKKGVLDSEAMTHIESEAMTLFLNVWCGIKGLPAYVVHDCVMIQDRPEYAEEARKILKGACRAAQSRVSDQPEFIIPAMTEERLVDGNLKKVRFPMQFLKNALYRGDKAA